MGDTQKPVNLRIPGPTPCPEEVREAMSRQMINHRGREFSDLFSRVTRDLKAVFQTQNDLLIFTSSGTGGVEAAVVNTLSPKQRVLGLSCGYFGDRFADIAVSYGANVVRLRAPSGFGVDTDAVESALLRDPAIEAVLVVHNETSTGVTQNLEAIAQIVKKFDVLLLVDAVSSMGAIPVKTDAWGLDVVVTASQKGFNVPPGLAFVSVSERAWQAHERARMSRFYFDFTNAKTSALKGQTPWTPAVSNLFALDVALAKMLHEGLEGIYGKHRWIASYTREQARRIGFRPFAEDRYASPVITSLELPKDVHAKQLIHALEDDYGIVIAGGQGELEGKIIRVAHLGWVSTQEIDETFEAIKKILFSAKNKTVPT